MIIRGSRLVGWRRLLPCLLACLSGTAMPVLARAALPDPVRIGVEGAYPPFSEVGPDGELKGFDIDIARALCAQMRVRCVLVQQNFDGMIPALNADKIDAVIASLSITEERRKSLVKQVKDSKIKVQASIQGEQIRVTGKKRDDLQQVIGLFKAADVEIPLQYVNFRD